MTATDIQQNMTNNIISLLDKVDLNDYQPPFAGLAALGIPKNPTTQKQYHGINILALWFNQKARNLTSNHWASYRQWQNAGEKVKKGEKGTRIVFYKTLTIEGKDEQGKSEELKIPILKQYSVFNATQLENFQKQTPKNTADVDKVEKQEAIDVFCKNTKAMIKDEANEAFYNPKEDYINIPKSSLFVNTKYANATENYYGTLLHELTHWTGHPTRLHRKDNPYKKHLQNYAYEELIAELGAAFLCGQFNTKQTQPKNHTLYIKSWLKALKSDKSLIFKAAAQASKAVAYLEKYQTEVNHDAPF